MATETTTPAPVTPLMEGAVIGKWTARGLTAAFLILIVVPSIHQLIYSKGTEAKKFARLFRHAPKAVDLHKFEEQLARDSNLSGQARRWYYSVSLRTLRGGAERVVPGSNDFLFYRQDVEWCATPQVARRPKGATRAQELCADPFRAAAETIAEYHRHFAAKGIHLVVVPIPLSPTIYPEKVWSSYPRQDGPAWNPQFRDWVRDCRNKGLDVVDLGDSLWEAKERMRTPLYIKFNSHWSPEGVGVAADYLAEYLRPYLTDVPGARYTVSTSREPMFSDLLTLMSLPHDWRKYRRQFHEVPHVQDNGHVLQAGDAAPVLLMGDSFCTMYTGLDGNGAPGGGLGQQLALRLGMAVQVQARASFSPTWQWLPVDGNPELLAHKRVVVWTFAARWLSLVDSAVWLDRPMLPLASQIKK